jgi:hypothetical protein
MCAPPLPSRDRGPRPWRSSLFAEQPPGRSPRAAGPYAPELFVGHPRLPGEVRRQPGLGLDDGEGGRRLGLGPTGRPLEQFLLRGHHRQGSGAPWPCRVEVLASCQVSGVVGSTLAAPTEYTGARPGAVGARSERWRASHRGPSARGGGCPPSSSGRSEPSSSPAGRRPADRHRGGTLNRGQRPRSGIPRYASSACRGLARSAIPAGRGRSGTRSYRRAGSPGEFAHPTKLLPAYGVVFFVDANFIRVLH